MPFELGRPLGPPGEPDLQRSVLRACLELLEREQGPVLEDFPDVPTNTEPDAEGWACPVNFARPPAQMSDADIVHEALSREIGLLTPWYEEAVRTHGRSGFGISARTPDEIARFLAGFVVDPAGTEPPYADEAIGTGFKRMADDLRYYYIQAAIARPGTKISDIEIGNWLWGETTLGQVLIAIRDYAMDCGEPSLERLAPTAMVPTHQRFRTKDG